MTQRHGLLLTTAIVCLLAAAPALAEAPAAPGIEPPAETLEAAPVEEEGGACVLPAADPAIELPDAALLPVEPIPAWCPQNEPCPHGFCLDYPDCPVAVCDGGVCRYW